MSSLKKLSPRKRARRSPSSHVDENDALHSPAKRQLRSAQHDSSFASLKLEFSEDLRNVSWVDLVEREEARERELKMMKEETSTVKESIPAQVVSMETTTSSETLFTLMPEEVTRRSRKPSSPKKSTVVPRYFRSLAMAETMENRRSERLRKVETNAKETSATSVRKTRKRNVSIDSSATDHQSPRRRDVRTSPRKRIPHKSARISSNNLSSTPTTPESSRRRLFDSPLAPSPYEDWLEPSIGWCTDENTLKRRAKEITKAKEKSIYQRYVADVPKFSRQKGLHPRTPNKYLNYSRRNWDGQVRAWKRQLYQWAGEEPSSSVNTSRCASECGDSEDNADDRMSNYDDGGMNVIEEASLRAVKVESLEAAASLFGHFDLDTRRGFTNQGGDESTLKAPVGQKCAGPTDFSSVVKQKL